MRHDKIIERLLNSSSPSIRYRMQRDFQEREPDIDLKNRILVSEPVKKIFKKMQDNVERPIAAILSLNTIAHTAGAAIAGSAASVVFGSEWLGYFSAVFTLAVLISRLP